MLELGQIRSHVCGGLSRRSLLRVGSLGVLGGFSWAHLLAARAAGQAAQAKADAAIVLWLWGGPSHIDLFDPKPEAPVEYRGPFEPIQTNVPGVELGELLPRLARRADRVALIRSMVTGSQDHGVAGTIGLTGSDNGAVGLGGQVQAGSTRPATGSIVARVRGFSPDRLPPYVILGKQLHQGHKPVVGEGAGTLGTTFDPFRLAYTVEEGLRLPDTQLPEGMTEDQVRLRFDLLSRIDRRLRPGLTPVPPQFRSPVESLSRFYDLALSLIASGAAREVLRVEAEPASTRQRYGITRFGQSCLLARRLVESGIPYVQVNWSTHVESPEDAGDGGWDMHDRTFQVLQDRHARIFDQAYTALLDELEERGLLSRTVVVAVGEFGRTPRINVKAGRDHWPQVYSALLAGGGVRGGTLVGASDRLGEQPAYRPVTPADLGATVLAALGIGVTDLTQLGIVPQGEAVHEVL
jgi:hypothetical protein